MREPRHVGRLSAWLAARGARLEPLRYARGASGLETCAAVLKPRGARRGRVVFAHATGNDAFFPQLELFRALVAADLEVLTFDLDGHGAGGTALFDETALAEALPAAMRAAGWAEHAVHLVGQSLGGALCLAAAAARTVDARSLTLVSTPLALDVSAKALAPELLSLARPALWRQMEAYGPWGIVPAFGPVKRAQFPIRRARGNGTYVDAVARVIAACRLETVAPQIACPSLVVSGSLDRIAPPSHARRLATLLPHARLLEVRGETHFTTLLRRDVCEEIAAFAGSSCRAQP